jgi:hypothetical protein
MVVIFFLWQTSASVSQFVFGMYGDRFNTLAPLDRADHRHDHLSCIRLSDSPIVLAILLVASGQLPRFIEGAALAGTASQASQPGHVDLRRRLHQPGDRPDLQRRHRRLAGAAGAGVGARWRAGCDGGSCFRWGAA